MAKDNDIITYPTPVNGLFGGKIQFLTNLCQKIQICYNGDMVKSTISDRVLFDSKKGQVDFLMVVKNKLNLSWSEIATILKINPRTARDWSKGKFNMSFSAATILAEKTKINLPKVLKVFSWQDHLSSISAKGGKSNYQKNGNKYLQTKHRLIQWQKWWKVYGCEKSSFLFRRKKIKLPKRNILLAEFVGIMMGDGGMVDDRITITLNSETDRKYSEFVCRLIKKLFSLTPKIYKRKNMSALDIVVHSRNLVDFCLSLGLKKGNKLKQNLRMPEWIMEKDELSLACVRGLFDTDGCVFIHKYKVDEKEYNYPKISFTSRSGILVDQVLVILKKKQFNARISKNSFDVRVESAKDVSGFMSVIGSSNSKHHEVLRRVAPNGKAAVC